jgi:hypothetical protein
MISHDHKTRPYALVIATESALPLVDLAIVNILLLDFFQPRSNKGESESEPYNRVGFSIPCLRNGLGMAS